MPERRAWALGLTEAVAIRSMTRSVRFVVHGAWGVPRSRRSLGATRLPCTFRSALGVTRDQRHPLAEADGRQPSGVRWNPQEVLGPERALPDAVGGSATLQNSANWLKSCPTLARRSGLSVLGRSCWARLQRRRSWRRLVRRLGDFFIQFPEAIGNRTRIALGGPARRRRALWGA